jgi:diaminobutyrate-2-oxoglutarate transaminase
MEDFKDLWSYESSVRYYCRKMPAVFVTARNALVWDTDGNRYIDFLSGCGSLNYGHNHPRMKAAAIQYLTQDGVVNGLDLHTAAKRDFIGKFLATILRPRGLDYRFQFTGPTGANAVEAALKLARKYTGRTTVAAFTNAFHGVSLGALAVTGSATARRSYACLLDAVVRLPFEGYHDAGIAELDRYQAMVQDRSGGVEPPAAIILETVQGEGGLNVASSLWLRHVADLARTVGALLIVDDIQAGCGRMGQFFSFERSGIVPDVVCLAKSLSGSGLPMAMLLLKPEHDVWEPGEHNGTFRGNNLAFVAATAALGLWEESDFVASVAARSEMMQRWATDVIANHPSLALELKGVGLMLGIRFGRVALAGRVARAAFDAGVLIETAGPDDAVLKLMPPLTIEPAILLEGLDRIGECIAQAAQATEVPATATAA